jgi:hypothetical protein
MVGGNVGYYMYKLMRNKIWSLRECESKEEILRALKKIHDHNDILKDLVEEIFMP